MKNKKKKFITLIAVPAILTTLLTIPNSVYAATQNTSPATVNFEKGDLTLDNVPTLDFGTQRISSKTENYQLQTSNPFIQVTDSRGTFSGWNLTAQISAFTATNVPNLDANVTLVSEKNTASSAYGTTNTAPSVTKSLVLTNSATSIINAANNTGAGTWIDNITKDTILTVKAGSAHATNYSATITWSLADGPTA